MHLEFALFDRAGKLPVRTVSAKTREGGDAGHHDRRKEVQDEHEKEADARADRTVHAGAREEFGRRRVIPSGFL